jgi:ATP-dependent Clp protease protease subunit
MTGRMHNERNIFITDRIDADVSQLVATQLTDLKSRILDPICIYINSPGEGVASGFSIYDFIEGVKKEIVVNTICYEEALSMASLIVATGTPGRRFACQNSRLMIHQPWSGAIQGKVSDVAIQAKEIQNQKDKLIGLYAVHVNRPVNEITNYFDRECLWRVSKYYGVPEKPVSMIISLCEETECCVKTENGTNRFFKIMSGVRQGCVISPFLFVIIMDYILR